MTKFGSVLKEIRKGKHMTQQMLASDICSQSVLSRIENNEEIPNAMVIHQLCQRLGITVDQVMRQGIIGIQKNQELLDVMAYYFHIKDYKLLQQLLELDYVEKQLYMDTELQRYYFYKGICDHHLQHNDLQALQHFNTSLEYTYSPMKHIISENEILIISYIGKAHYYLGNTDKALNYLNKSIDYFYAFPHENFHYELLTIFFNISVVLIEEEKWERAEELIKQGISWAKNKFTFYYLDELFALKGIVLEKKKELQKADSYTNIVNVLKNISL